MRQLAMKGVFTEQDLAAIEEEFSAVAAQQASGRRAALLAGGARGRRTPCWCCVLGESVHLCVWHCMARQHMEPEVLEMSSTALRSQVIQPDNKHA